MQLKLVKDILNATVLSGDDLLSIEVDYGYGCDLMSDVLAFVKNNVILLTGLVHPQVIRTAEILDIKAITFVRGKKPEDNIIQMANRKQIVLLSTTHSLFTACALLYSKGLQGEEIAHDEFKL